MPKPKRPMLSIIIVVVVLSASGAAVAASPRLRQGILARLRLGGSAPAEGELIASGFIEADEISIAAELGGRVVDLAVDEGEEVEAGQELIRLDGTLLDAQIEAAQAGLDLAQARLAQGQAGARPEDILQAQALVEQAKAARDGAHRSWLDLQALRAEPQALDAQIAQARAQVAVAEAALSQATALKDAAEIAYNAFWDGQEALEEARQKLNHIPEPYRPSKVGLPLDANLIPNRYWQAWVSVNGAQATLDGARTALQDLYAARADPQDLNAQVDVAEAQQRATEAAVARALAQLDGLRAGATAEEIAALEAQVQQAQAALDSLLVLRSKQTISAPIGGLVLERSVHVGELAAPGVTLLSLGDLDEVTLTVYVPEDRLGQVWVGQPVLVTVDSFPERQFEGKLVAIADEAEFTPRNVQTQEERVAMVFAIEVQIPNPDHALKPGIPADATLIAASEE